MERVWSTLAMLLARGGWVMIPLFALSVISVALSLERGWFWFRTRRSMPRARLSALAAALRSGQLASVAQLVRRDKSIFGDMVRSILDEANAKEAVAIELIEEHRSRFERFMPSLSTIITAAPLIGILGTVIGIIESFELLGESRMVMDPREVSSGIAQALLTTAAGLVVALITLFPYMVFKGYIDRAIGQFEVLVAAIPPTLKSSSSSSAGGAAEMSIDPEHGKPDRAVAASVR